MAVVQQAAAEVAADETGTSGDKNMHNVVSSAFQST
jgi:hypothetical protein